MLLQWTTALSVGVDEIDAQHQELFRRVDRLLDAMARNDRSEAARLLEFLLELRGRPLRRRGAAHGRHRLP